MKPRFLSFLAASGRALDTCTEAGVGLPTAIALSAALVVAVPAAAQSGGLGRMSLEDLLKIEITSASRKEQRADQTPAAVFVITHEDIRRSGATTLPDVLRMAPGVDVARVNPKSWSVSVRGFNGVYANKLLVMIDGRTIYNSFFGGVSWDADEVMLDDVDRVEVIRGPGGSIWGANAVNGVINIITRPAADTLGSTVYARTGSSSFGEGAARYGGAVGESNFRVYTRWASWTDAERSGTVSNRSNTVISGARLDRGGFRVDGSVSGTTHPAYNLDASALPGQTAYDATSQLWAGHALTSWTRTVDETRSLTLQAFTDFENRSEPQGDLDRRSVDLDAKYRTRRGRHDLMAGGGFRKSVAHVNARLGYSYTPSDSSLNRSNVFAQDEIALDANARVRLTPGAKIEWSEGRSDLQPSARLLWLVTPESQSLWAAVSKAVRVPSLVDRGVSLTVPYVVPSPLPIFATFLGNPNLENETVVDSEIGYRTSVRSVASFDVTGFVGHYGRLRTNELLSTDVVYAPAPHIESVIQFGNRLDATTKGVELAARWFPHNAVRFDGTYSAIFIDPHSLGSLDPNAAGTDMNAPSHQWRVHAALRLVHRSELDLSVQHTSALRLNLTPAFTRADARVEWPLASGLTVAVVGQNLFSARHTEYDGSYDLYATAPVPRSAVVELRWRSR